MSEKTNGEPVSLHDDGSRYSVYQFFEDGSYERVRHLVSAMDAAIAVGHYCNNVATRLGITQRVIITDSGDCIAWEWINGKGITFPPKEGATDGTH